MSSFIERLPLNERKEADQIIGEIIYEAFCDERTRNLAAFIPEQLTLDDARMLLTIGMFYISSSDKNRWLEPIRNRWPVLATEIERSKNDGVSILDSALCTSEFDTEEMRTRSLDFLAQGIEDAFTWFALIDSTEGIPDDPKQTLIRHPVIFSATSLKDPVNRTVVAVLKTQKERGDLTVMPRTRNDLLAIFYRSPEILSQYGTRIEGVDFTRSDWMGKGLCPAKTWDEASSQTWLEPLLDVCAQVYLAHR